MGGGAWDVGAIAAIINSLLLHNFSFLSIQRSFATVSCELNLHKISFPVSQLGVCVCEYVNMCLRHSRPYDYVLHRTYGNVWRGKEFNLNYDHNRVSFIALYHVSCTPRVCFFSFPVEMPSKISSTEHESPPHTGNSRRE